MSSVHLLFKKLPEVNSLKYLQQFDANKYQMEAIRRDLNTDHFYRNTNLKASVIAILTVAAMGAMYYYFLHLVPKSIRGVGDYNMGAGLAVGRAQMACYFAGIMAISLIATMGFGGAYFFARSESNDRALLERLMRENSTLKSDIQNRIKECETNMEACDVALSKEELPDGRDALGRDVEGHIVADWAQTPWRALQEIVDPGNSQYILAQVQGQKAQSAFLQSQEQAISQFKQVNETVGEKLTALQLLLA